MPVFDSYRDQWRTAHGTEPPPIALNMNMYCHADAEIARERALAYIQRFFRSNVRHYEFMGTHFKDIKGYERYDEVAACSGRPGWTVILLHLDTLDEALTEPAASLLASPRARLIGTLTERPGLTGRAQLIERFPVVLDVPPLRERLGDIPDLVAGIISELHPNLPARAALPGVRALASRRVARGTSAGSVRWWPSLWCAHCPAT